MEYVPLGGLSLVCAIVSGKWAMELGFSQVSQLLWGVFGLVTGPLALLLLYARLIRANKGPGGKVL